MVTKAERVVREILRSDPCQKVDFIFKHIRVSGDGYNRLYLALIDPLDESLSIVTDVSKLQIRNKTGVYHAGAAYSMKHLYLPSDDYGDYPAQKMSILHELTHAQLDWRYKGKNLRGVSEEGACYVAGCIYNLFLGQEIYGVLGIEAAPLRGSYETKDAGNPNRFLPIAGPIFEAAEAAAWSVKDTPGMAVPDKLAAKVLKAVGATGIYSDLSARPWYGHPGF